MLRSDVASLLNGFDSRMKFINIVRSILDYPMRNNIQEMIPDRKILDNIVVMILVYIKEQTLSGDRSCTMSDIENFIEQISTILPPEYNIDNAELAKFIMTDALRNGGVPVEYTAFDPVRENFFMQPIRLVQEQKGCYHLTDDAFDFLFRSKEIESELDYSVTRFRMQEYMKRDNYTQALDQSRELVSRIRNLKISMDDFLLRCREQLSTATEDAYDSVIMRIRALLTDEEQELENIRKNADARAKKLDEALRSGVAPGSAKQHRSALSEIIKNINLTIEEQRGLINKRYQFQNEVSRILQDHFSFRQFERMRFKEDMLIPLQYMENGLESAAKFLLFPLTKPVLEQRFSIEKFYETEMRLSNMPEDESISVDTVEEDPHEKLVSERNERFLEITRLLFEFIEMQEKTFSVSSFVSSLSDECLFDLCADNSLPNVLLSLYEIGDIDIDGWKASRDPIPEPMGEFELAWCLGKINETLLNMRSLHFAKQNRIFSFSAEHDGNIRKIDMTDICVEVIR